MSRLPRERVATRPWENQLTHRLNHFFYYHLPLYYSSAPRPSSSMLYLNHTISSRPLAAISPGYLSVLTYPVSVLYSFTLSFPCILRFPLRWDMSSCVLLLPFFPHTELYQTRPSPKLSSVSLPHHDQWTPFYPSLCVYLPHPQSLPLSPPYPSRLTLSRPHAVPTRWALLCFGALARSTPKCFFSMYLGVLFKYSPR